jgi:hypothetical protein
VDRRGRPGRRVCLARPLKNRVAASQSRIAEPRQCPKERLDELLKLTERYCAIYHTLRSSPAMEVRVETV